MRGAAETSACRHTANQPAYGQLLRLLTQCEVWRELYSRAYSRLSIHAAKRFSEAWDGA